MVKTLQFGTLGHDLSNSKNSILRETLRSTNFLESGIRCRPPGVVLVTRAGPGRIGRITSLRLLLDCREHMPLEPRAQGQRQSLVSPVANSRKTPMRVLVSMAIELSWFWCRQRRDLRIMGYGASEN